MGLMCGGRAVDAMILGDRPVKAMMLGGEQVWPVGSDTYVADWSDGWGPEWTPAGHVSSATATGGVATLVATNTARGNAFMALDGGYRFADFDLQITIDGTSGQWGGLVARWDGATGSPWDWPPSAGFQIDVQSDVKYGVGATLTPTGYGGHRPVRVRVQALGSTVRVKAWPPTGPEPAPWAVTTTNTDASGDRIGLWVARIGEPLGGRSLRYSDCEITPL